MTPMKKTAWLALLLLSVSVFAAEDKDGWISLFDGKSLEGWKTNENAETFKVEDGKLVVLGKVSHLLDRKSVV